MMAPTMIDAADNVTRMLPVSGPLRLRFRSGSAYFAAELRQDLLGDWMIMESWTSKPGRPGGGKTMLVGSLDEGFELMQAITARQEKRGYRLV